MECWSTRFLGKSSKRQSRMLFLQESENLDLDIKVLQAGALAVLRDHTKGVWFVIEARSSCNKQILV